MSARRWVLVSMWAAQAALGLTACRYDIDKIYKHTAGPEALPTDLIDLWKEPALSEECAACARSECAEENLSCRDDENCVAFTKCVADARDPAAQNDCRAQQTDWLLADIIGRESGGPYQQCVFRYKCAEICNAYAQLECTKGYNWPKAVDGTSMLMHLRLVEGLLSTPAPNIRVRACRAEDPATCLPLTDWVVSNGDGYVELKVSLGLGAFLGYLEMEGTGFYPALVRFGWPVAKELVTTVSVVSQMDANIFLSISEVPQLADRGFMTMRAFGCSNLSLREVTFGVDMADGHTADWYTIGDEPLPRFALPGTGVRGAGGIVNVVPGRRLLSATHQGAPIALDVSAPVRAGYMTVVHYVPDAAR